MKNIYTLLFCFITSLVYAAPPEGQGYELVWSDEFDGIDLDTNNWVFDSGPMYSSVDWQYYTNDGSNFTIDNGNAVLWVKKEDYLERHYTSCRLISRSKREFKYGYIEIRLRIPEGSGLFPAFYTFGNGCYNYVGWTQGWPDCGEMSIFYTLTGPYNYTGPGNESFEVAYYFRDADNSTGGDYKIYHQNENLSLGYHLYALEWDSLRIQYFFDDQKFWEYDTINESYNFNAFHQPHYFNTEIRVNENFMGDSIETIIFPQAMYIDYVRVYQKTTDVREFYEKNIFNKMVIENPEGAYLKLYDMRGRLIADLSSTFRSMKQGEQFSIKSAVSVLPQGVYLARIYNGMNVISQRLVIQR